MFQSTMFKAKIWAYRYFKITKKKRKKLINIEQRNFWSKGGKKTQKSNKKNTSRVAFSNFSQNTQREQADL